MSLLFFFFFLNPAANPQVAHHLYSEAFLRQLDTTFHDGAVCWLSCEKSSECAVAVAHSWNGFRLRGRAGVWFGVSGVTVVAVHSRRTGSLNGRDRKCWQQGSSCASFIRAKGNVVLRAWLHIQTPSKYPSRPVISIKYFPRNVPVSKVSLAQTDGNLFCCLLLMRQNKKNKHF